MRYCRKCGLPENYPGICISEKDTCNYCDFFESVREVWEDREGRKRIFEREIEQAKKKAQEAGADYDCIVGLSGGKDSIYVVYELQKRYGMRVLTFTFDNGFTTEFGRRNVEVALGKLNADHLTVRMREDELRRQYQTCVNFLQNFCSVCFHFMHYYSHLLARQYKIPLIVNGRTKGQILQSALNQKGIEPFEISRNLKDFEYQMFGRLVEKLDARGKSDYLKDVEVTSLSYFAYHDVTDEEKMELLEKELGWIRPASKVPHADCWAHPMAEYFSLKKRKFPVRTGELAVEVRMGNLSVEEAERMLDEDRIQYETPDWKLQEQFYRRISPGRKREAC
ncbi:MAG: hypothetical protein SOX32_04900 [Candidatus Choladocola sp.]|nr:hypothetical protein [Candidatus Choladocola sp.]